MNIQFNNIGERLLYIINTKFDGCKKEFSKSIGHRHEVIANIISGRRSKPSFLLLKNVILTNREISSHWILTGRGEILQKDVSPNFKRMVNYKEKYVKLLEENRQLFLDNIALQKEIFLSQTKDKKALKSV